MNRFALDEGPAEALLCDEDVLEDVSTAGTTRHKAGYIMVRVPGHPLPAPPVTVLRVGRA